MPISASHIKKDHNTRLYYAKGTWLEKDGQVYSQEYIISAADKGTAIQIAHNHLPAKFTRDISPKPGDNADIIIRDYGLPLPNRTYYSSPIFPNTYKSVMPGPVKTAPVAPNSIDDTAQKPPVIIQQVQTQTEQNTVITATQEITPHKQPQQTTATAVVTDTNKSQPTENQQQKTNPSTEDNNIKTIPSQTNDFDDENLEEFDEFDKLTDDFDTIDGTNDTLGEEEFEEFTSPTDQPSQQASEVKTPTTAQNQTTNTQTQEFSEESTEEELTEEESQAKEELKWIVNFAMMWGFELAKMIHEKPNEMTPEQKKRIKFLGNYPAKAPLIKQWAQEYTKNISVPREQYFYNKIGELLGYPYPAPKTESTET